MGLDHPAGQRQPDAEPLGRGAAPLGEALEDAGLVLGRDAGAVVGDGDSGRGIVSLRVEPDPAAVAGVPVTTVATLDPNALCAQINAQAPGACTVVAGKAQTATVDLAQLPFQGGR